MFLRATGATDRAIDGLVDELSAGFGILSIDVPGVVGADGSAPAAVDEAADHVLRGISEQALSRWLICARSGYGEIVSAVVTRVLDGTASVFGLAGAVELASPSPVRETAGLPERHETAVPRASFEAPGAPANLVPRGGVAALAALIAAFAEGAAFAGPEVPADFARVIASPRTSSRTRGILARRLLADDASYRPTCLTPDQLVTLRAVADRVVPQEGRAIDLAARLDAQLARGEGDGWRSAELPTDPEAYSLALTALGGLQDQTPADQDARLQAVAASEYSPPGAELTAAQLGTWFEDACADLTRLWLAHPASLARVGFDGFATGGDAPRKLGFRVLSAGERESWEPRFDLLDTPGGRA